MKMRFIGAICAVILLIGSATQTSKAQGVTWSGSPAEIQEMFTSATFATWYIVNQGTLIFASTWNSASPYYCYPIYYSSTAMALYYRVLALLESSCATGVGGSVLPTLTEVAAQTAAVGEVTGASAVVGGEVAAGQIIAASMSAMGTLLLTAVPLVVAIPVVAVGATILIAEVVYIVVTNIVADATIAKNTLPIPGSPIGGLPPPSAANPPPAPDPLTAPTLDSPVPDSIITLTNILNGLSNGNYYLNLTLLSNVGSSTNLNLVDAANSGNTWLDLSNAYVSP